MASGPLTSWQIDGETVEKVADFIFLGSKITADGDCGYEIKRQFPGIPVVKTWHFHCHGQSSIPGWRTKILQAM